MMLMLVVCWHTTSNREHALQCKMTKQCCSSNAVTKAQMPAHVVLHQTAVTAACALVS
jgi:hypothetical protein